MSTIAENIQNIINAKASIKEALANKGVTVPESAKLAEYGIYVNSIEQGGGGSGEDDIFKKIFYRESIDEFRIPSDITEIPPYCFYQNTSIRKYIIPSTVKSIKSNAFFSTGATFEFEDISAIKRVETHAFNTGVDEMTYVGDYIVSSTTDISQSHPFHSFKFDRLEILSLFYSTMFPLYHCYVENLIVHPKPYFPTYYFNDGTEVNHLRLYWDSNEYSYPNSMSYIFNPNGRNSYFNNIHIYGDIIDFYKKGFNLYYRLFGGNDYINKIGFYHEDEKIKILDIPEDQGFTEFTHYDFYNLDLNLLILPSSVTNMGSNAPISGSYDVVCKATTPPSLGYTNQTSKRKCYVPDESVESYQNATKWVEYFDIVPISELNLTDYE